MKTKNPTTLIKYKETYVELTDEAALKGLNKTLDLLDADDDVQAVYHNWDE